MKKILICGAGGTPSLNFIRSLKKSSEKFHFIGITSNKYDLCKAEIEVDERYLVSLARDQNYFEVLKSIIKETTPDFLHAQNDFEIFEISKHRDEIKKLGVRIFYPKHSTIDICVDKAKSYEKWKRAGIKVPETLLIKDENSLRLAFKKFGKIWLRIREGGFGYGSLPTKDFNFAKAWIDYYKGWGKFTAAECLEKQSVTWMSIWKGGKLIVAQGRKRLYWEFANRNISGITGITGTGVTISDSLVDRIARKAIFAIDKEPNGIFSVDLTYDRNNVPNPTEINIARFFTTHNFFTEAGLNMPYIYIKAAFNEPLPSIPRKINPLEPGLAWVRGMDVYPVLTTIDKINKYEGDLNERIRRLKNYKDNNKRE